MASEHDDTKDGIAQPSGKGSRARDDHDPPPVSARRSGRYRERRRCLEPLLRSGRLARDGIFFLAPTGKARVRIRKATADAEASTVAQFSGGTDAMTDPSASAL